MARSWVGGCTTVKSTKEAGQVEAHIPVGVDFILRETASLSALVSVRILECRQLTSPSLMEVAFIVTSIPVEGADGRSA